MFLMDNVKFVPELNTDDSTVNASLLTVGLTNNPPNRPVDQARTISEATTTTTTMSTAARIVLIPFRSLNPLQRSRMPVDTTENVDSRLRSMTSEIGYVIERLLSLVIVGLSNTRINLGEENPIVTAIQEQETLWSGSQVEPQPI